MENGVPTFKLTISVLSIQVKMYSHCLYMSNDTQVTSKQRMIIND